MVIFVSRTLKRNRGERNDGKADAANYRADAPALIYADQGRDYGVAQEHRAMNATDDG